MTSTGKRSAAGSTNPSLLRGLLSRYRWRVALLAGVSFVGALLEALFLVIITGVAMALVAASSSVGPYLGQSTTIPMALGIAAALLTLRLAINLVGVRISAGLTASVTEHQRHVLSDAYLRTAWSVQQAEPAGQLQALLTGFVSAATNAVSTFTSGVIALLSLIAFLGTGLAVDAGATGAVLIALAVVAAILMPLRRRIRRRSWASAGASLDFANSVSELGALGLEMQTFGVRHRFAEHIDQLNHETTDTQRRVQILTGSLAPIYITLAYAAVLAGVAVLTVVGSADLAVIGAVILLMLRSLSYGQQLASAAGSIAASAPFLERIHDTVERYHATMAANGSVIPLAVTPLEARDVDFAYTADRRALTEVSFRIDRGDVVGVIGPSGAGKSTLAQLLLGLLSPVRGSMTAGHVDLNEVDRAWWSQRIAFVAQEATLFTGTVTQNIRFFRDGISDEDVRLAARQANVLVDIEALPHGFGTHLGERGGQLSGGQRQRLSIARALAGKPELLVLDEPTSALDGQSEALIRDTLGALSGKVTVVIIAHRMSTLEICDRIMVIESGRVTAFATPEELRRNSDFYREALTVAGIA
jgi:ATP-binding cassette, subfamily B, bacterial